LLVDWVTEGEEAEGTDRAPSPAFDVAASAASQERSTGEASLRR